MSQDHKEEFCAHIMSAARTMGFGCSMESGPNGWKCCFTDGMTLAEGNTSHDRKDAVYTACLALRDQWSLPFKQS